MTKPRSFLCGGIKLDERDPLRNGRHVVEFSAQGPERNVHIHLLELAHVFNRHFTQRMEDLLEIASYVYAADCSTSRAGQVWSDGGAIEPWKRDFQFIFPVRDLDFWDQDEVKQLMVQILQFLSQDAYTIVFQGCPPVPPIGKITSNLRRTIGPSTTWTGSSCSRGGSTPLRGRRDRHSRWETGSGQPWAHTSTSKPSGQALRRLETDVLGRDDPCPSLDQQRWKHGQGAHATHAILPVFGTGHDCGIVRPSPGSSILRERNRQPEPPRGRRSCGFPSFTDDPPPRTGPLGKALQPCLGPAFRRGQPLRLRHQGGGHRTHRQRWGK